MNIIYIKIKTIFQVTLGAAPYPGVSPERLIGVVTNDFLVSLEIFFIKQDCWLLGTEWTSLNNVQENCEYFKYVCWRFREKLCQEKSQRSVCIVLERRFKVLTNQSSAFSHVTCTNQSEKSRGHEREEQNMNQLLFQSLRNKHIFLFIVTESKSTGKFSLSSKIF